MANLDYTCSPNLPPSANIAELSAEQLRRVAIEAVQIRDSWTKGPSPSIHLELKQTIVRNPAASVPSLLPHRFFPGGRFLAALDSFRRLRVIDLHDGGRLVWGHDLDSDVPYELIDPVDSDLGYDYDVGVLEDGTLIVAYKALWIQWIEVTTVFE